MRKLIAPVVLSLAIAGCAGTNSSTSGISAEQAQAGVAYLESTVSALQTALDAAKATGDPAKVATAQKVLDQAKSAAEAFKSTIPTDQGKWDAARSIITTAVSVLGPIAVQALVSGS